MKKQIYKNTLLIVAVALLVISLFLGIGVAVSMGAKSSTELKLFVNNGLTDNTMGFKQMLFSSAKRNLIFTAFAFVGSFNIWLFAIFVLAYMFQGFSVGFSVMFTLKNFSAGISAAVIASSLLYILLLFPIYIIFFCISYKYAVSKGRTNTFVSPEKPKMLFKRLIIFVAVYIFAFITSIPEALINPLILKLL